MKRYKCTNYRRFITFIIITLLLLCGVGQLFNSKSTDAVEPLEIRIAIVEEGDSLWRIAEKYDNNKMDLREYIDIIQAFNKKNNTLLQPGERLRIPIY